MIAFKYCDFVNMLLCEKYVLPMHLKFKNLRDKYK